MSSEIQRQLEIYALRHSKPFCYSCHEEAPSERCLECGSDDLMRLVPGVGCEYGLDWVIRHLVEEKVSPMNTDEEFEESVRLCYPEETKVGWMKFDSVSILKEMDPVSWKLALSDWESQQEDEENIISFDNGGTYYRKEDIEQMIKK